MGIVNFVKNIGRSKTPTSTAKPNIDSANYPAEYIRTLSFNEAFDTLLSQDKFIARSDYKHLVEQYSDLSESYTTLAQSSMLPSTISTSKL